MLTMVFCLIHFNLTKRGTLPMPDLVSKAGLGLCIMVDIALEAVCHRFAIEQSLNWNECDANSSAYQYLKQQGIIK